MKGEILATGDEIRSGALIDSNSAFIAERLEREGIEVTRHHCVGDDLGALSDILLEISQRADIAVVTGGLGPTTDDRTAEAAGQVAGVKMELNPDALAAIELFFKRLGRPMTPSNRKQAFFPRGSKMLPNPIGTAPGFMIEMNQCTFFCLPGVPVEMRKMLDGEVIPRIISLSGNHRQVSMVRTLSTFGATESMVAERLSGIATDFPEMSVGYRAKFPEIQVRLYSRGNDTVEMSQHLDIVAQRVGERLGDLIFSSDGRSMAAVVGDLLVDKNATVAVAESCTGGLVSHWLTNTAGSSRYFLFSGVTYANDAKMDILGVSETTLTSHGAVSLETVREMAVGAQRVTHATYAISTSGIAGPDGGGDEKPVGTVCVGLAVPDSVTGRRFYFPYGNRLAKKTLFAMAALDTLRRHLLNMEGLDMVMKRLVAR